MSPPVPPRRGLARAALVVLGLVVGFVCAEVGARALYPALPSLAALHDRPELIEQFEVEGLRQRDDLNCVQHLKDQRGRDVVYGAGEPRRVLWFAGDSMTAGMGVEPGEAWPEQLTEMAVEALGGAVVVRNLAVPGVAYCEVLRRVHSELQHGQPDVVFLSLFGDDLESRALLARDGELIGLPHTIASPALRWAARRSYVVNLGWFAASSRPSKPVRFIDGPGRRAFQDNLVFLADTIRRAGAVPIVVLIEPVGIDACTPAARENVSDRCHWMAADLDLMASLLDEGGVSYVDLRGAWRGSGARSIPSERTQVPAVHPDAGGHRHLAGRVWAASEETVRAAGR